MVITSRTRNAVARSGRVGSNPTVSANTKRIPSRDPFSIDGQIVRDSNPKGRDREAKLSSGQFRRERVKPTVRGGADRRIAKRYA